MKYSIIVKRDESNQIIEILCDCMWGSLHPENYQEGGQICKHIKEYINNVKYKKI